LSTIKGTPGADRDDVHGGANPTFSSRLRSRLRRGPPRGKVQGGNRVLPRCVGMLGRTTLAGMTTYENGGVKRLTRSSSDKMLAGVCGGLAEYTGWDVALIRLAVVAATLFSGGAAIIAYLAAIVIMPTQ
jgi:phage shock protein C